MCNKSFVIDVQFNFKLNLILKVRCLFFSTLDLLGVLFFSSVRKVMQVHRAMRIHNGSEV